MAKQQKGGGWPEPVLPTVTKADGPTHDSVETHPAYAQISASRVSGGAYLYGSDFKHQHFVMVSIGHSVLHRGLSEDRYFGGSLGQDIATVMLSEAQWATFVSTLNHGCGTPCTLRTVGQVPVPGIAAPTRRREQFETEQAETVQRAMEAVTELERLVEAAGLSDKKKKAILWQAEVARRSLTTGAEFVGKQFSEHIERTVEGAKTEIEAYLQATVARAGLKALGAGEGPLVLGEGSNDDTDR